MEVEGEMCGFDSKKAALFCSGSPYRTVSVCVRQNEEKKTKQKKTGTSPILKNPICRTEQQNIQAQKNTLLEQMLLYIM